jgi:hypothetical protein
VIPRTIHHEHVSFPQQPDPTWDAEKRSRWDAAKRFADAWDFPGWSADEVLCREWSPIAGFGVLAAAVGAAFGELALFGMSVPAFYLAVALLCGGGIGCMWVAYRFQRLVPVVVPEEMRARPWPVPVPSKRDAEVGIILVRADVCHDTELPQLTGAEVAP